jgi:hypothetical protein
MIGTPGGSESVGSLALGLANGVEADVVGGDVEVVGDVQEEVEGRSGQGGMRRWPTERR